MTIGRHVDLRVVRDDDVDRSGRPVTRGDCVDGPRPCPWVSCLHHLYLDVSEAGSVHIPRPDLDELAETCALDVADRGPVVLDEIATALNVTRKRARQIEAIALDKLKRRNPQIFEALDPT